MVERKLSELKHPNVNERIYKPISPDDPAVVSLARGILAAKKILEPLIITLDDCILSGNRRATAARLLRMDTVPCVVEDVTADDPRFIQLLVEANNQRVKTPEEQAREAIVTVNAEDAHQALRQYRAARVRVGSLDEICVDIIGEASRCKITEAKVPMLQAALAIVEANRRFWPLTLRQIHYLMLNDPPLKNADDPKSRYANDKSSYKNLSDLLLRARFEGLLSWDAMHDPSRPMTIWDVHSSVGDYARRELRNFLRYYRRDLQQGQPRHLEIVGEKNTIASIIRPVAMDFCIPISLGRGYSSGNPRKRMAERFARSGRDELVLLVLSDFDPEGEDLAHQFARSMRDELNIPEVKFVKVALSQANIDRLRLPQSIFTAKEGSSRRSKFVERHGEAVYELEAARPEDLQTLLREAIETAMDVPAFLKEQRLEREDAAELERIRRRLLNSASELDEDA